MAQSSYRPSVHPVAIISPQFCAPYPVDITIASKLLTINKGDFTATDVNGNVMFRIRGKFFSLHGRHILLDAAGNPMLTLQHKVDSFDPFCFSKILPTLCSDTNWDKDVVTAVSITDRNGNFQILTAHKRWQVFRGDTTAEKDLLFSVKKSSLIQFKTQLDVFLAGNTNEDVCDFKIKGSWGDRSCTIYLGNTLTIIAQVINQKKNPS
ncbi:hypothetical protein C3L33_20541, partial [Rhododendron williamsianum]